MSKFNKGWYLMYTKPNYERKVCDSLTNHNIEFFLPQITKVKTWSDRKKYVSSPLFPSYIFIYLNNKIEFFQGQNIAGVLCYVRIGKELAKVCDHVIINLKLILNIQEDIEISKANIKTGQKITIERGPLAGLDCEVVQLMGTKKILVRSGILERNIIIPEHHIAYN